MVPHVDVHRRSHHHWRGGRKVQGAEKIVADAAAEFGKNIRGGRRNQQQIRALRHGNVFNGAVEIGLAARFRKQIGDYFFSRERRERQRPHELAGRAGHHHFHAEAFLLQAAHQFGRFVGRNSAGDAEDDMHGNFRDARRYLRRLVPSFSSSTLLPGSNSYSIKPLFTSSQASRVAFSVRGLSRSGGAPAMI